MQGGINYVALACSALSLILNIAAVAIPNWILKSPVQFGLWKLCHLFKCIDMDDLFSCGGLKVTDSLKATGALLIIGLIMMVVAIVVAVLKMFVMKDNSCLSIGAAGSAIAAGLLILVGAIVFAVKVIDKTGKTGMTANMLSGGFALAIVSSCIAIVAGILFYLGYNKYNICL
ncbi:hypothetical protein ACJMK2_004149 [Sinanodonta woodiana]|uniref:Claudin n=1 Tax=Sinanodonta woodiana TaxID=1069815 RepID=A0ABD3Y2V3_SINWO